MRSRSLAAPVTLIAAGLLSIGSAGQAGGAFPGGNGRVAFERISRAPQGEGFRDTIYTVTKRGTRVRALTSSCCMDDDPAWSPSGKRAAFVRGGHVFIMRADGTDLHKLTKGKRYHGRRFQDAGPSWSPNGGRLVFWRTYETSKNPSDLFTVRSDSSKLRSITTTKVDEFQPSWSPRGNRIAFGAVRSLRASSPQTPGIYTMRPNGRGVMLVFKVRTERAGLDWSPNARRLAYSRFAGGAAQVFTVRASGNHPTQLTHLRKSAFDPAFSPNGKHIVFTSGGSLHLIGAHGGKPTALLKRHGRSSDVAPDWQSR
jgi:Tol biopolymer transport system component